MEEACRVLLRPVLMLGDASVNPVGKPVAGSKTSLAAGQDDAPAFAEGEG